MANYITQIDGKDLYVKLAYIAKKTTANEEIASIPWVDENKLDKIPTLLDTNSDLNNSTNTGDYYGTSGNYSGLPSSITIDGFYLNVRKYGNNIIQILYGINNGKITPYYREYKNNVWNSWNKAADEFVLNKASADSLGGIKIGYSETGGDNRNYAVKLDGSDKAYVTVPWTDTVNIYDIGNFTTPGLVKSKETGTGGTDYNVEINTDGTMKVNVPNNYSLETKTVEEYITELDGIPDIGS